MKTILYFIMDFLWRVFKSSKLGHHLHEMYSQKQEQVRTSTPFKYLICCLALKVVTWSILLKLLLCCYSLLFTQTNNLSLPKKKYKVIALW